MDIVFALGGSVLMPKDGASAENIKSYAQVFKKLKDMGHNVSIVVGGGNTAREYIKVSREFTNESVCDEIGIMATRMNAMLLISALSKYSVNFVPTNFKDAEMILNLGKILVMGGTHPAHTTDAVSATLAEFTNADLLVIATNVDGVYTKDPRTNNDAKKLEKMTTKELIEITGSNSISAGSSSVVDSLASKIIDRAKLKTIVVKGTPDEILKSVLGGHDGTIIIP
ncbi:uridylate kinase, putative [Methanococcus vannielii SB]|uniref:Uridylate kinase n=1 Tax=Methanococcus vannielii (strain ATCC 35089 / DSM 1224 / JCM 13029 / OCM 148 / SB) TaxID=406327 RepID=PYRH_METVS|nr:UMP kinase [Methanococcus vannielii]A6URZ7.1 RecName: Full=Uridylate kinase; Short=UK; AltName: Full=Uridine monophosphate kinase; Short=UMP kinase; Short=UMPK [Methanococcus vannielii SB]ABR55269.1 uridylate kinase, putative [Methanococcus vannielii SB]